MITDPVAAADAIASAFALGPARQMSDVAAGYMGKVWRLECASGAYAVKESWLDTDVDRLTFAASFCDRARAAGVAAPRPIRSPDGSVVVRLEGQDGEPHVRVAEWVEGTDVATTAAASWLGTTVAAIETLQIGRAHV